MNRKSLINRSIKDNSRIVNTLKSIMASKAELSISLGKLAKQLRIHHRIICNCLERKGKSLNINSQISSIGIETIILRFSKNDMPQKFSKTYNNQEKTNLQKALGKN